MIRNTQQCRNTLNELGEGAFCDFSIHSKHFNNLHCCDPGLSGERFEGQGEIQDRDVGMQIFCSSIANNVLVVRTWNFPSSLEVAASLFCSIFSILFESKIFRQIGFLWNWNVKCCNVAAELKYLVLWLEMAFAFLHRWWI